MDIDEALADWAKKMQRKVQEVNTNVDNGLLKAALYCEGQAKQNAMDRIYNLPIPTYADGKPRWKRTGLYKASIGSSINPNTPHSAIIYNSAPYAKYLEFGTSRGIRGKFETLSVKAVFGEGAGAIPMSSTKSMTGHTLGACGGIEAAVTVLSLRDQRIHMTRNLEIPDPECDLDYVPEGARSLDIEWAMSNSLGFGGHNSSLVFRRWGTSD